MISRSRDNSVVERWATGWMMGGSSLGRGWEFFSSLPCPDRLWGPPSLLWVPEVLSLGVKRPGGGVKMTTRFHLVPKSTMREAIHPHIHSPNTASWRGGRLKKAQGQLYLYLTINDNYILIGFFPFSYVPLLCRGAKLGLSH
jgi:hypothetical protein